MNKNLLVEYKGGGYDGCFWEWNYFMFDENGEFVNLYATGYKGIKNENEALELMETADPYSKISTCDLTDREDIKAFVNEGNPSLMAMLAEKNEDLESLLMGSCDICGENFLVCDLIPGGYSGDGGIAISAKEFYCKDCYYNSEKSDFYAISTLIIGDFTLKLGDFSHFKGDRKYYNYVLLRNDEVLFSGNDYSPSPMGDIKDVSHLIDLLGCLTVGIGDTDNDFFKDYNSEQMEFAKEFNEDREFLSSFVSDYESGDQSEYWDLSVTEDENGSFVYEVTGK